jgi:hypothetical protein
MVVNREVCNRCGAAVHGEAARCHNCSLPFADVLVGASSDTSRAGRAGRRAASTGEAGEAERTESSNGRAAGSRKGVIDGRI